MFAKEFKSSIGTIYMTEGAWKEWKKQERPKDEETIFSVIMSYGGKTSELRLRKKSSKENPVAETSINM